MGLQYSRRVDMPVLVLELRDHHSRHGNNTCIHASMKTLDLHSQSSRHRPRDFAQWNTKCKMPTMLTLGPDLNNGEPATRASVSVIPQRGRVDDRRAVLRSRI